jgi:hypothetical protein
MTESECKCKLQVDNLTNALNFTDVEFNDMKQQLAAAIGSLTISFRPAPVLVFPSQSR